MRLISRRLLLAVGLALLALPALGAPRAQHVVIISLDGGKPAVIRECAMPVLTSIFKAGAGTWSAQTIYPPVTLPSHTSMLTGVGPAKHKVDWNTWDPEKGLVAAPTIFLLAKQHGLSTAMFAGKPKFRHLELPGSLDMSFAKAADSIPIAKLAAKYIVSAKPSLCFVHFPNTDEMGHKHGWGSPEQKKAFEDEDEGIGIVRKAIQQAGIASSTVLIVTADHGGHDHTHGSRIPEDMTIPWVAVGAGVRPGVTLVKPVTTYDTAATALWLLDVPIPKSFDGKPVTEAFGPAPRARR